MLKSVATPLLAALCAACNGDDADPPRAVAPPSPAPSAGPWSRGFFNEEAADDDTMDDMAMLSDVAIAATGEVMVTGSFRGALRLGAEPIGDTHPLLEREVAFFTILEPDGVTHSSWVGGRPPVQVTALGDDFLIGLSVHESVRIGDTELSGADEGDASLLRLGDASLVRLATDGSVRWTRALHATVWSSITALAASGEHLWVAGLLRGSSDAHPRLARPSEQTRAFLFRLDPQSGAVQAAATLSSPSHVEILTVAPQADGGAMVLGEFGEAMTIGDEVLDGEELKRAFIARFDSEGNVVWARRLGDTAPFIPYAMTARPDGSTIVVGNTHAPLAIGDARIAVRGPLALGLTGGGDHRWTLALPDLERAVIRDLFPDGEGARLLVMGLDDWASHWVSISADGARGPTVRIELARGMIPAAADRSGGATALVANTETAGLAGMVVRSPDPR